MLIVCLLYTNNNHLALLSILVWFISISSGILFAPRAFLLEIYLSVLKGSNHPAIVVFCVVTIHLYAVS